MSRHKRYRDTALIGGPYRPPRTKVGDLIYCERHGESVVACYTDLLRWPCAMLYGQRAPLLCGELCDAVRTESVLAICHWWQVSRRIVNLWRRCLGVGRMNPGSRRLRQLQTFSPAERRRGTVALRKPAVRAKQSDRTQRRWDRDGAIGDTRRWTPAELRLLGRLPDAQVAKRIGRTRVAVSHRRIELRIPAWTPR